MEPAESLKEGAKEAIRKDFPSFHYGAHYGR
jgi:hypothetical protein